MALGRGAVSDVEISPENEVGAVKGGMNPDNIWQRAIERDKRWLLAFRDVPMSKLQLQDAWHVGKNEADKRINYLRAGGLITFSLSKENHRIRLWRKEP